MAGLKKNLKQEIQRVICANRERGLGPLRTVTMRLGNGIFFASNPLPRLDL
jgi:hypothetical protein